MASYNNIIKVMSVFLSLAPKTRRRRSVLGFRRSSENTTTDIARRSRDLVVAGDGRATAVAVVVVGGRSRARTVTASQPSPPMNRSADDACARACLRAAAFRWDFFNAVVDVVVIVVGGRWRMREDIGPTSNDADDAVDERRGVRRRR